MASNPITTTSHDNFIPELWSAQTIDSYETGLILSGLCDDWSAMIGPGDKVTVPVFINQDEDDVQTIPETKQAKFDPQTTDDDGIELTMDQMKYASIEITDPLKVFANVDLIAKYSAKLGYPLAKYVDSALATGMAAASEHTAQSVTLSTVTDDNLVKALATMMEEVDSEDVPMDNLKWAFSPAVYWRLARADHMADISFSENKSVADGRVLRVFGVPVLKSNNLYSADESGTTYTYNMLVEPTHYAYAAKPITVLQAGGDGRFVHTQITAKVYYGHASVPNDGAKNYGIHILKSA